MLHNICVLRGDELDVGDGDDDDSDDGDDDDESAPPPPPPRLQLWFYKPLFKTLQINRQYPLDFALVAS